jgi:cytochrome c553
MKKSILRASIMSAALIALAGAHVAVRAAEERVEELIRATMQLEPKLERGEKLYREQCAACHGLAAFGDTRRFIPSLAGQRRAYIVKQLADFTEHDRIATQMHSVVVRAEVREPQAWIDLAAHLNGLPAMQKGETGNGEHLSLGEASYEQWCVSCHEEDGRGDDDGFVPSLRNQHYSYLLGEARNMAAGHRFNVEGDLRRFLESVKSDEAEGIADYLSRMRGPVRDRLKMHDDGTVGD